MHFFEGASKKIKCLVRVRMAIASRPDVDEAFVVHVAPERVGSWRAAITVYIQLNEPKVAPAGCSEEHIRWLVPADKRIHSALLIVFWCTEGRGTTVEAVAAIEELQVATLSTGAAIQQSFSLRERVGVEHLLAHLAERQGPKARYRGPRRNLFDLRRITAVQNLETIHRRETRARLAA